MAALRIDEDVAGQCWVTESPLAVDQLVPMQTELAEVYGQQHAAGQRREDDCKIHVQHRT